MLENFAKWAEIPIFRGIEPGECALLLRQLNIRPRTYRRGEIVLLSGEPARTFGVVLEGSVRVEQEDAAGQHNLLARLGAGELFAEVFACLPDTLLPVTVFAAEECCVLLLPYAQLLAGEGRVYKRLVENLLRILAQKNCQLSQTIQHLSRRSIREKLLSYLSAQAVQAQSTSFTIPLNRQELADYLCVDRSALSAELSRMRAEGLLQYHRSHFTLNSSR